ncbi:hypothetical protein DSO57_1027963 [Entomophthora muscae]|uniref:Uncharacterized protein n=1 Tax=Entomophthora muscae TaxID=34485 RepID=A0ACC2UB65_9FUNG|nr:hypothetical protein DSO57_1027963 [Entomophthora muscae]
MTLPLTPQCNHPMEPPHCHRDHVYSTVWSTLHYFDGNGRHHGAQLRVLVFAWLAPILWWALPTGLAVPHPESPNASTYAWLPDRRAQDILATSNNVMQSLTCDDLELTALKTVPSTFPSLPSQAPIPPGALVAQV